MVVRTSAGVYGKIIADTETLEIAEEYAAVLFADTANIQREFYRTLALKIWGWKVSAGDKILQINTFRGQPCLGTLTKLLCLGVAVFDCFRDCD